MIAFLGSVFSPWYAFARRRGTPDPEEFVAVNVAVYDRHGGWAMTERGRPALARDAATFRVGPSSVERRGRLLTVRFDEVTAPIPRRLRGVVRVELPERTPAPRVLDARGGHLWQPLAPFARIEVDLDGPARSWRGDGYVDHNRGDEPLEDRFESWNWARATDGEATSVVYDLRPRGAGRRAFALRFSADGGCTDAPVPPVVPIGRTGWGLGRAVPSQNAVETDLVRTLEDTPFYARSLVRFSVGGRSATGIHETLSLDRFRMPLVQAMLPFRMPRRRRWSKG